MTTDPTDDGAPSDGGRSYAADPALVELVERMRAGDDSALGPVIRATRSRLFRFCVYLTGSAAEAEELCQETYIKAMERIDRLGRPEAIQAWLFKVARNHFIDQTRSAESKLVRREVRDDEESGRTLSSLPAANPSDLDALIALNEALGKLPPEDRAVLILIDHEEYSYAEAAEILNVTEGSLRSRLHRARKAFLEIYHEEK